MACVALFFCPVSGICGSSRRYEPTLPVGGKGIMECWSAGMLGAKAVWRLSRIPRLDGRNPCLKETFLGDIFLFVPAGRAR